MRGSNIFGLDCRFKKWVDHTFDHLQTWTVWKQCLQEHRKAPISDTKAPKSRKNHLKIKCATLRDVEVASSNLVTSTKKQRGANAPLCFWSRYSNSSWFAKQTQVRIPHSEIDKLACQAESVGITERSGVTLFRPSANVAPRPKSKSHTEIALRMAFCSFCFLRSSDLKSEIVLDGVIVLIHKAGDYSRRCYNVLASQGQLIYFW